MLHTIALQTPAVDVVVVAFGFLLVVLVVGGHCGHDAQNHCLHASCQPPPKREHTCSLQSTVVVVIVLVVLVVDVVVVNGH